MGGRPVRALLLSAVLAAAGACEAAVNPIVVLPGCPEKPVRGPQAAAVDVPVERLIDDFEDPNIYLPAVGGRTGFWMAMSNLSSSMLVATASAECAARGFFAGHFAGAGFTPFGASWTAYFEAQPVAGFPVPFDGSGYSGISFWAAAGDTVRSPYKVELGLSTIDTVSVGGVCTTTSCLDYYRKKVELTYDWQQFVIPYTELSQKGTGLPMRTDQLVAFLIWPETQFDVWIDDIRFEP